MESTKTFKRYNFVTGVVDGTLAYDFSAPGYAVPDEEPEVVEAPRPKRAHRRQEWVREEAAEQTELYEETASRAGALTTFLATCGAIAVILLVVMVLFAQIHLIELSTAAVELEQQIDVLQQEHDSLTVQYETIFNLKSVEEYATGVLGMQEPREDQVYYLSDVSSADKAVILTGGDETGLFSIDLDELLEPVKEYIG